MALAWRATVHTCQHWASISRSEVRLFLTCHDRIHGYDIIQNAALHIVLVPSDEALLVGRAIADDAAVALDLGVGAVARLATGGGDACHARHHQGTRKAPGCRQGSGDKTVVRGCEWEQGAAKATQHADCQMAIMREERARCSLPSCIPAPMVGNPFDSHLTQP